MLLHILKFKKLINIIASSSSSSTIGIAIWESEKLIFYTPNFSLFTKIYNINFEDFKNVSIEKLKMYKNKYPALKNIFDNLTTGYHDENLSFEIEIPIGNDYFLLKFYRIILNKKKYSIVFLVNISENIQKYSESLLEPFFKIPSNIFKDVLNRNPSSELAKKLYHFLSNLKIIDSLALGTKQKDGSIKIHYANIDGEELIDFVIPPLKKSVISYIIDFKTKEYIKDSEKFELPPGYKKIQVGEKVTNSIYGVPLMFDNKVFGAVLFEKRGVDQFTVKDMYVFDILANILSINFKFKETIENLHIEKEINYKNSLIDPLTKAYNRNFLKHFLEKTIEHAKRTNQKNTLVFVDLDNFKEINDKYGHHFGDEVLKRFVKIAKQTLRKMDVIVRYGGDEFLIILPKSDIKNSKNAIRRLKKALLKANPSIEFSYGLINLDPEKNLEENFKAVDKKMYEMKKETRKEIDYEDASS
ncbi:diguanylate cyclase [Thermosipho africanus H17ap60334]|uniref:sensor domain-containing diguanylate cyclase n=1 Tax=Thermosipho africanus TaxID=2421 RepID=UPI00028EC88C|nr:sensor domain-containing diguanylate cyclase [Thermosipho africanus]EKF48588.1 diguanylate cyclase [Thermosipho africanus H17ap60334]